MDSELNAGQAEGQTEGQTEGQVAGEGQVEGAEKTPETVPYDRFKEVNDKLKASEEREQTLSQQVAVIQANMPTPGQRPQPDPFDIYKKVGLEDPEDIPTVEQSRKINAYFQSQTDAKLAEIRFLQEHPDFTELIGTEDQIRMGQYATPIREAVKNNPALISMIQNSKNPPLAAYELVKLYQKQKPGTEIDTKKAQATIDEAVANAGRIKSTSNVRGGSALSEEGRYAKMPDGDFLKLARSHGAIV